jgi:hypothetical protein
MSPATYTTRHWTSSMGPERPLMRFLNASSMTITLLDSERIESYLKQLKEEDDGFSFRIAKAPDGSVIGYIWITPWMPASWEEDFEDVVFLDMIKRQLFMAVRGLRSYF